MHTKIHVYTPYCVSIRICTIRTDAVCVYIHVLCFYTYLHNTYLHNTYKCCVCIPTSIVFLYVSAQYVPTQYVQMLCVYICTYCVSIRICTIRIYTIRTDTVCVYTHRIVFLYVSAQYIRRYTHIRRIVFLYVSAQCVPTRYVQMLCVYIYTYCVSIRICTIRIYTIRTDNVCVYIHRIVFLFVSAQYNNRNTILIYTTYCADTYSYDCCFRKKTGKSVAHIK